MEGQARLQQLSPDSLGQMHRAAIEDPVEIRRILQQVCDQRILLTNGVNHLSAPRTARIQRVAQDRVLLAARHIDDRKQPQIFLSFGRLPTSL